MRTSRLARCLCPALAAFLAATSFAEPAQARRPRHAFAPAPQAPVAQPIVSLTLEHPGGVQLPAFLHLGSMFFAGQQGDRYNLRLTNNTGGRVEVVVTVDGRDVISGEIGNYKRQRGYVLEPYGSAVVEGFRQSLDQVAAFRFSALPDSYTAQRGTPTNVGVIGVAVFSERKRSAKRYRRQALAAATPAPPPHEPYYRGPSDDTVPEAFPDSPRRSRAGEAEAAEDAAVAPSAEESRASGDGAFAPIPSPEPEPTKLGTAYGESQYSAVREIEFKRRRRRKPDAFLTVYYDSPEGLAARGISLHNPTSVAEPQPFPQSGFAPPPPRR